MARSVDPAWEQEVFAAQVRLADPILDGRPRAGRDLELHRTMGLVLHDGRAIGDFVAVADVANAQCHQVAASQLAVESEVEQGELARALLHL